MLARLGLFLGRPLGVARAEDVPRGRLPTPMAESLRRIASSAGPHARAGDDGEGGAREASCRKESLRTYLTPSLGSLSSWIANPSGTARGAAGVEVPPTEPAPEPGVWLACECGACAGLGAGRLRWLMALP